MRARLIWPAIQPPVDEALIPEVLAYEGEAARYGLTLFHQTGITDVDQWFSNYTSADQAYLLHFYRTCDKGEFKNFWRENAPLVEPKAILRLSRRNACFAWTVW